MMKKKAIFPMRIIVLLILTHVAMFILFYSVGQLAVASG